MASTEASQGTRLKNAYWLHPWGVLHMCHHILLDGVYTPLPDYLRAGVSIQSFSLCWSCSQVLKLPLGLEKIEKQGSNSVPYCYKRPPTPTFVSLLGVLKAAWTILLLIQSLGSIHNSPPNWWPVACGNISTQWLCGLLLRKVKYARVISEELLTWVMFLRWMWKSLQECQPPVWWVCNVHCH